MNIFSVLDVSDNEEEVKVKPVKKAAKDTKPEVAAKETKTTNAAPKAPKANKEGKPQPKQTAAPAGPAAVDPVDASKENTHGKHLGKTHKHGEKNHGKEGDAKKQPKRVFDRKSANGRGNEVSRDGRGKFGTGSVKQEAEDAEKHRDATVPETEGAEEAETEAPVKEEVVDTTMSYEEFLRKREEARTASSLLAPAKATRVVDVAAQFAGLKTVEEGEVTYIAPKVVKGTANVKKDQRSTGKSQIVDVSFKFESANNDYRRRDDNRDNRAPRGDTRKPRPAAAAGGKSKAPATVFNTGDFPSL